MINSQGVCQVGGDEVEMAISIQVPQRRAIGHSEMVQPPLGRDILELEVAQISVSEILLPTLRGSLVVIPMTLADQAAVGDGR